MARFVCPNQHKNNQHQFLMCRLMLGSVRQIQDPKDALKAYCPHQKYCSCTQGAENTEQAKACYEQKMNQTAKAD